MTFKEILEKLKINAKKVLRGKSPEDSLPVYSKDYNDLIDALKNMESGSYAPLFIVRDADPTTNIIISDAEGNFNQFVQIGEDLVISGHEGEETRYNVVCKFKIDYNRIGVDPTADETVNAYVQIFKEGELDPIQTCVDAYRIPTSLPYGALEYSFIFDFISLYNLKDGDFIRIFINFFPADIITQSIGIGYNPVYFSFYIEKTNLVSNISVTLP